MSLLRVGWPLVGALLLSGCNHMAKAKECRELARTVNSALDEVEAMKGAKREQPAALHKAADRYARLAAEAKRAKPTHDPELGITVDELASGFMQTAAALRKLADQNQKKQAEQAELTRRRIDNLARSEKSNAMRIDSLCRSP